ncbi:sugar transferase, partial [Lishizhenia sp.]|uniref:sugar transferase n=1 Tax=Lishizhenia sp. TaxID=2497594 RepID=UPI00299DC352
MQKKFTSLLIVTDFLMAALAWASFFYFRKTVIEVAPFVINTEFILGVILIPAFWVTLHALLGTYINPLRLYRMKILSLTTLSSIIGTVVIFFVFLLDDEIDGHHLYYKSLSAVFILQFCYTLLPRFIIVNNLVQKVHAGKIGFNTLLIGGSQKAVDIYDEIKFNHQNSGNKFIGFVNLNGIDKNLEDRLPYLGHFNDFDKIITDLDIEEIIIALDSTEHEKLRKIIAKVSGRDLKIKVIPDMYDILSGSVKMNNIFGAPLIELNSEILPIWQRVLKRGIDVICASIALILLTPVYITLAILVKTSSEGPIFF